MEIITKKTVSVEYGGKRYALQDDSTISSLLSEIGLPEDTLVRIKITKEGFLLIPNI